MTLVDHFRGDQVGSGIFQVRPRGTQVLAFCDRTGTVITPTSIEVTYIRYPLPAYKDEDVLELPGYCPAVKIKALQKLLAMLGFSAAADKLQTDYRVALTEMKATEPQLPLVQPTRMFRRGHRGGITQSYMLGESLMNESA